MNLLTLEFTVLNKYVIGVMETLFTNEELKTSIIKSNKSRSKRNSLDENKINILKLAVKHKFKVPERKMPSTWREVLKVAKRRCYDSDKKK